MAGKNCIENWSFTLNVCGWLIPEKEIILFLIPCHECKCKIPGPRRTPLEMKSPGKINWIFASLLWLVQGLKLNFNTWEWGGILRFKSRDLTLEISWPLSVLPLAARPAHPISSSSLSQTNFSYRFFDGNSFFTEIRLETCVWIVC